MRAQLCHVPLSVILSIGRDNGKENGNYYSIIGII